MHQHRSLRMCRHRRIHAAQQTHTVGVLGSLGHELTDPETALAMLIEFERTGQQLSACAHAAKALTVVSDELRLVIKGVHMRRSARHAQEDHALRLYGMVRSLWRQRIAVLFITGAKEPRGARRLGGHTSKCKQSKATGDGAQCFAAC